MQVINKYMKRYPESLSLGKCNWNLTSIPMAVIKKINMSDSKEGKLELNALLVGM